MAELVYDPRYLAGIVLFNRGDFFEAHEVWEGLWMETAGADKRFYQSLIQAAVGLLHFCNGNVRGAAKLYRSSKEYMQRYDSPHLGLDISAFWGQMETCFAELLATENPDRKIEPREELIPTIELSPPPASWPDPAEFIEVEEPQGGPP
jgi:predicted metal-dependent hydrolase